MAVILIYFIMLEVMIHDIQTWNIVDITRFYNFHSICMRGKVGTVNEKVLLLKVIGLLSVKQLMVQWFALRKNIMQFL